ncbi:MAG: lipase family alpha/beta hydrolase [Limisphaerales bacterium]
MSPYPPHPVVFVPGIMGSELQDQYPAASETVYNLWTRNYGRMALHPNAPRYEARQPAQLQPSGLLQLIYSEFIEELRHNLSPQPDLPTPVFAFAYDWRQPLQDTALQLREFILETIERTRLLKHYHAANYHQSPRVNLVGHSMGGLIIADYLHHHPSNHLIHKITTLGTPFHGSPEAVLKLATGHAALGGNQSASREREIARITPSLYHLLPSYPQAITTTPPLNADLFEPASWQPSILESIETSFRIHGLNPDNAKIEAHQFFAQMLQSAKQHIQRVNNLNLQAINLPTNHWLAIVGLGEPTQTRIHLTRDPQGSPRFNLTQEDRQSSWSVSDWKNRTATGDGTVPYTGARPDFLTPNQLVCVSSSDFGYWEIKDRLLESLGPGLHATLPLMNLTQRLTVSHFACRTIGHIWGRRAPDSTHSPWSPPIPELEDRSGSP